MVTKTLSRYLWFVVLLTLLETSLCGKDTKNGLTEENAQVTVSVYNPADVPGEVLSRAEQTASRIFQRAGIEVNWLNCQMPAASEEASRACRELAFPTHLHLRIVRKPAGGKGEDDSGTFGKCRCVGNASSRHALEAPALADRAK